MMTKFRPTIVLCMMLMLTLASTSASADVLVLRSDTSRLNAGSNVKAGSLLRVQKGRAVLLLQSDGSTLALRGPTSFTVPETQEADQSVINAFIAMFKVRADTVRLGGVRDGTPIKCDKVMGEDSWKDIASDWNSGCQETALNRLSDQLK